MRKSRPSPATLIATAALFFSLGGTGLAASRYLITSTSQIKPSVLRHLQGARGPAGAPGASGIAGPVGASGPMGPIGDPALLSSFTEVSGPELSLCPENAGACATAATTVDCPPGWTVISGGYAGDLVQGTIDASIPSGETGWTIIATNDSTLLSLTVTAYAVCAH